MGKLININFNTGEIDEPLDSVRELVLMVGESIQADFNDALDCPTVSARDVHDLLGEKKEFTSWFKYYVKNMGLEMAKKRLEDARMKLSMENDDFHKK